MQGETPQRYQLAGPSTQNTTYEQPVQSNFSTNTSTYEQLPDNSGYEPISQGTSHINDSVDQSMIYEDACNPNRPVPFNSSMNPITNQSKAKSKQPLQRTPYEINEPVDQSTLYENPTTVVDKGNLSQPIGQAYEIKGIPQDRNTNDVYAMPDMQAKAKGRLMRMENTTRMNPYEINEKQSNKDAQTDGLYAMPDMALKERQQSQQNNDINSPYEINERPAESTQGDEYALPDMNKKKKSKYGLNEEDNFNIYYNASNTEHPEISANPIYTNH
jgi:hypothetical protein